MSEHKRYCGRCDRETVHEHWKDSVMGGRANMAERLFEGFMTFGASELINDKHCRCLRCGFQRKLK